MNAASIKLLPTNAPNKWRGREIKRKFFLAGPKQKENKTRQQKVTDTSHVRLRQEILSYNEFQYWPEKLHNTDGITALFHFPRRPMKKLRAPTLFGSGPGPAPAECHEMS